MILCGSFSCSIRRTVLTGFFIISSAAWGWGTRFILVDGIGTGASAISGILGSSFWWFRSISRGLTVHVDADSLTFFVGRADVLSVDRLICWNRVRCRYRAPEQALNEASTSNDIRTRMGRFDRTDMIGKIWWVTARYYICLIPSNWHTLAPTSCIKILQSLVDQHAQFQQSLDGVQSQPLTDIRYSWAFHKKSVNSGSSRFKPPHEKTIHLRIICRTPSFRSVRQCPVCSGTGWF